MAEFTGERLIPGQVEADLLNEHMARYAFATRLAHSKRVLDAGCGAGYGSAELASVAALVIGADVAHEAVTFAQEHYRLPNLHFEQATCLALPHADASVDLVVAFEVIEHLHEWREFLMEARRVLTPHGQFIVSTPNRLYYTESRGAAGANPFHVHEFEFEEFRSELRSVFPHVSVFLENHVEGVLFQPYDKGTTIDVRLDAKEPAPQETHFFVAVCEHQPRPDHPVYVYLPRTGNVLRERGRHITLLEEELAEKDKWLERATREHQELVDAHQRQTEELERSNRWAENLNREIAERRARVEQLQNELVEQREGYAAKVAELEEDIETKVQWARDLEKNVERTEKELQEHTAWALSLESRRQQLEAQLTTFRASRWVKLGRNFGLGPDVPVG